MVSIFWPKFTLTSLLRSSGARWYMKNFIRFPRVDLAHFLASRRRSWYFTKASDVVLGLRTTSSLCPSKSDSMQNSFSPDSIFIPRSLICPDEAIFIKESRISSSLCLRCISRIGARNIRVLRRTFPVLSEQYHGTFCDLALSSNGHTLFRHGN